MGRRAVTGLVAVLITACADDGQDRSAPVDGVTVPAGYTVTEVVTGLVGPTQLVVLDDGTLLVAQLAGGERDGTGQVVRIDPARPDEPTVLFDGLLTPTGVTVAGDQIYVMEQRRLSAGALTGGRLTTIADDLPFNGRSEGTLTTGPDGEVLYDTSGALAGGAAAPGSATLWALPPGGAASAVATGFKHAYARTFGADGTLWQTEIADGRYDGAAALDELVAVRPGDDFGWPQCVGDRLPVEQYGGTADGCAATPRSQALFPAGATPTSVAVAPWDPELLLVALWNAGLVVSVTTTGDPPVEPEPFVRGLDHPQHLVADGERLLVVDFGGGRILAVSPT